VVGRRLDFDFPPSQDVARLDYTFTFNSDDTKVTGTITLTTFPLQGDPLDGGGTVEGQFTYNCEPLAGCRQKSITILPLVSQGGEFESLAHRDWSRRYENGQQARSPATPPVSAPYPASVLAREIRLCSGGGE
jgi:hypothetical protein